MTACAITKVAGPGMPILTTFFILLSLGASTLSSAEQAQVAFADQIAALRTLPDVRLQWVEVPDKEKYKDVSLKQVFLSKEKFFQFDNGKGKVFAYSPRGFQIFSTYDGLMKIEKEPAKGSSWGINRGSSVPAILYPLRFLGMKDGDLGDDGLVWSDIFTPKYLEGLIASVVKKTIADDRGGWWVTIPYKTPNKQGMGYEGAYLHVHIEPVAACRQAKLVTRIEYAHDKESLGSAYEFTYDLVAAVDGRQYPMLKSGRWISPDGMTVYGTLERTGVELGKEIPEEDIAIDHIRAKRIMDVNSGLSFHPDQ